MARQPGSDLTTPSVIAAKALMMATQRGIATADHLTAILNRFVDAFTPQLRDRPGELEEVLCYWPFSLCGEVLDAFELSEAERLLRVSDLSDLARRIRLTEYILRDETPVYTLPEL